MNKNKNNRKKSTNYISKPRKIIKRKKTNKSKKDFKKMEGMKLLGIYHMEEAYWKDTEEEASGAC